MLAETVMISYISTGEREEWGEEKRERRREKGDGRKEGRGQKEGRKVGGRKEEKEQKIKIYKMVSNLSVQFN